MAKLPKFRFVLPDGTVKVYACQLKHPAMLLWRTRPATAALKVLEGE